MLEYLTMNRNLTFVWPEGVFLQQWYEELTQKKRADFKKLVVMCLPCFAEFQINYQFVLLFKT